MNKYLLFLYIVFFHIFIFAGNGFSDELSVNDKINPTEIKKGTEAEQETTLKEKKEKEPDTESDLNDEIDDDFYESNGTDEKEISDPFEPFNRVMWSVNEYLFDYVLKPVARGYRWVTPNKLRHMIKNFFSNISTPVVLVSSILQGSKDKVDRSIGRFFINSTVGALGLFDPAKNIFHIKKVSEDFDQALGYYHIPSGPFLMLPLLGPSTVRGMVGRSLQTFFSPEFLLGIEFLPTIGFRSLEMVNEVSFNLENMEEFTTYAIDPYTSVKDFYTQRRKILEKE